jgi:hypothetical protein
MSEQLKKESAASCASFNMIIVGMAACGKTHYLLQQLKTTYSKYLKKIF